MTKVYADIEHQIEVHELTKFKELADHLGITVQETIEMCMFERRDEYLDMVTRNIPSEEEERDSATSERATTETEERVEKEIVADTIG